MSNPEDFVIGRTGTLTGYTGAGGNVVIPEKVKNIGRDALTGCQNIVSLIIPNGVKEIRDRAFYRCSKLESIIIPDSVIKFGEDVFAGCFSLKNVQAPDWIAQAIDDGEEMDHAACIERPPEEWRKLFLSYATGYGTRIDFYHGRQKLVYVPDWVNFVGGFNEDCAVICHKRVFDKFRNEIRINSALAYLGQPDKFPGDYANVPRNYIKKNRRVIEERILHDDDISLLSGYIDFLGKNFDLEAVNSLLDQAESTVNIRPFLINWKKEHYSPEKLEKIQTRQEEIELGVRERTVAEWKKLWKWTELEDKSLCLLKYLGNEPIPTIPTQIGKHMVSRIGREVFRFAAANITDLVIPEGVMSIEEHSISYCPQLTRVSLPSTLIRIGKSAFTGCYQLNTVEISSLDAWCRTSFEDFQANPLCKGGTLYLRGECVNELTMPASITTIGNGSFAGCGSIRSIVIPETMERVGLNAFSQCKNLTEVVVSSHSKTIISNAAFQGCSSLTTVFLPESVTVIGENAFRDCQKLTIIAPAGSHGERFAKRHDIPFKRADSQSS